MQARGGGYRMLQSQRPRMMVTQSYRAPFDEQQQQLFNNYQQDNYGYQHYMPRPLAQIKRQVGNPIQSYQYEFNLEHYPIPYEDQQEEEFSNDEFGSYPPPPSSLTNFDDHGNYSLADYQHQQMRTEPYYQHQAAPPSTQYQHQQFPMMQFRHVNVPPIRHSAPSSFQTQVATAQYGAPVASKTQRHPTPSSNRLRRPLNPSMDMLPPPKPKQSAVKRKVPMKPSSTDVAVKKNVVATTRKPQEPPPPPPFLLYDDRILSGTMQQLIRWKDRKHIKNPPIYETAGILMSDEVLVNGYRHEMEHRFCLRNLPEWRRDAFKEDQELDCVYYAEDRSFSIFSEFSAGTILRIVGRFFGDGRLFQVFKFREATEMDLLWMTDRLKSFDAVNSMDELRFGGASGTSMTQKQPIDLYDDPCAMYFF